MRTIFKFTGHEDFYNEKLKVVKPRKTDKVIYVTTNNMKVDGYYLDIEGFKFEIFPKLCEVSKKPIYCGYLVNNVVVSEKQVNKYCKQLGFSSWNKFIHTETLLNTSTNKYEEVYISEKSRKELLTYGLDTYGNKNGFYDVSNIDLEDPTTDDSYYTEWEEIEEVFYLANGLKITDFEEETN